MNKKNDENSCCGPSNLGSNCCKVEAVLTIDAKGQILLPKELRKNTNLQPGDKLIAVNMTANKDSSVIVLMKAENFGTMVKNFLGPVMSDIFKNE